MMSLFSDSESSNSSLPEQTTVFGSSRVLPNSPTPYTDATQTKKNSPHRIKRPMNAFMVFSHHERKKVVTVQPEIHNTLISKELGRRWKNLPSEQREPFIQEADRLRELHVKEYPDYKYKPTKKKATRTKLQLEENDNQKLGTGSGVSGSYFRSSVGLSSSSWTMSRIRISTGQRDVLKSINHNRFNSFTIDRKFKDALKKRRIDGSSPSFLTLTPPSLAGSAIKCEPSPPCKVPYSPGSVPWAPSTPDPHSNPFYGPDSRLGKMNLQYSPESPRTVPVSPLTTRSCPITPLSRPGGLQNHCHPLGGHPDPTYHPALTQPPSPLFSTASAGLTDTLTPWDMDSTSLPDLSACLTDIFPSNPPCSDTLSLDVGDLKLDWPTTSVEQTRDLATNTLDEDIFGENWIDKGLMAYVTQN